MKNKVVIFGNGELAQIAHFYLTHDSSFEVAAFCVDHEYLENDRFLGLPLIAFEELEKTYPPDQFKMLIMLSYKKINKIRQEKYAQAKEKGYDLISYVSSKATVWPGLKVGENCFIMEDNVIQPFTEIGSNVVLWSGNHIGHHSKIEDHCFLASHIVISGGVNVRQRCFIGVNATLRDHIEIGEESVIGAGALILEDVKPKSVLAGHSARKLSFSSDRIRKI